MAKKSDELVNTTVRLPQSQVEELDREAERMARETLTLVKRSDVVRIAVRKYLEHGVSK